MGKYNEVEGNLITLSLMGKFDVITHGCNCFCTMQAGIAPQMAKTFHCNRFPMEITEYTEYETDSDEEYKVKTKNKGDINKLGCIDYLPVYIWFDHPAVTTPGIGYAMSSKSQNQPNVKTITVVNSYTQYHYGANHKDGVKKPVDYEAITMCMRKINHTFKGQHIGLPKIGAGLAGGDWDRIKTIIQSELKDCEVTVVIFKP